MNSQIEGGDQHRPRRKEQQYFYARPGGPAERAAKLAAEQKKASKDSSYGNSCGAGRVKTCNKRRDTLPTSLGGSDEERGSNRIERSELAARVDRSEFRQRTDDFGPPPDRLPSRETQEMATCFVTHVNSPSEFWIQIDCGTNELQTIEAALVDARDFPELTTRENGTLCAAVYPVDRKWYRARVVTEALDGIEVFFTDYGNVSTTKDLRTLPDELKDKPALSYKCALQKPHGTIWSSRSTKKLTELAADGTAEFQFQVIASEEILIVGLYSEGGSVTEQLIKLNEEDPPHVEKSVQEPASVMKLNEDDPLHIENSLREPASVMKLNEEYPPHVENSMQEPAGVVDQDPEIEEIIRNDDEPNRDWCWPLRVAFILHLQHGYYIVHARLDGRVYYVTSQFYAYQYYY